MFWATRLLPAKFSCSFAEPLLSPSPAAALRILLTGKGRRGLGTPAQAPHSPGQRLCLPAEGAASASPRAPWGWKEAPTGREEEAQPAPGFQMLVDPLPWAHLVAPGCTGSSHSKKETDVESQDP